MNLRKAFISVNPEWSKKTPDKAMLSAFADFAQAEFDRKENQINSMLESLHAQIKDVKISDEKQPPGAGLPSE
jgi:hypothetical protein